MATRAQMIALENQVNKLKLDLEAREKAHKAELEKIRLEHQKELDELKNDLKTMTRKDVIKLIMDNLKINVSGGYNGSIDCELYFGDCFICSSSDNVSCDNNPMDE